MYVHDRASFRIGKAIDSMDEVFGNFLQAEKEFLNHFLSFILGANCGFIA
jgi:hypothetical protein